MLPTRLVLVSAIAVCGLLLSVAARASAGDDIKIEHVRGFQTARSAKELRAYWESVKDEHKMNGNVSDHLTTDQIDLVVMLEVNIAIPVDPRYPRYLQNELLGFMAKDNRFKTERLPEGFDKDDPLKYLVALFRTKKGDYGLITRYKDFAVVVLNGRVGVAPLAVAGNEKLDPNLPEVPAEKAGREEPPAQTVTVVDRPDFLVRLVVKPRPSLADRDWLAFEFVNRGKQPIAIENARYNISFVAKGREEKKWLLQTGLDGGNRELFPKTWKPGAESAVVLKPGETYRVSEYSSDLGASSLGLPPRDGLDIACALSMYISTTDRQVFETPREGLKFAFEWVVPDEAGLKVARARLTEMLKNPVDELHHHLLLRTFLGTEEVAKAASRDDLLAALKLRKEPREGRPYITDALIKKHGASKEVIAFYQERLRAKEYAALSDVNQLDLWSPSFIPAVADFYGPNPTINAPVLEVLHRHRADWLKAPDEVKKLLAQLRKQHPALDKDPKKLEGADLEKWAVSVSDLALVADPSAVSLLRPALEDKRVWWRPDPQSALLRLPSPLVRVCDTACDAISTILDGKRPDRPLLVTSVEEAFKAGLFEEQTEAEFIADRDARIERLRKRLADRDKDK